MSELKLGNLSHYLAFLRFRKSLFDIMEQRPKRDTRISNFFSLTFRILFTSKRTELAFSRDISSANYGAIVLQLSSLKQKS